MKTTDRKLYPELSRLFPVIVLISIILTLSGCGQSGNQEGGKADMPTPSGNSGQAGMPGMMATEVAVVTVSARDVPVTSETTGKTESYRTVEVRSQVSGTLLERAYIEGSIVKKGDLLFQIDPTPFQTEVNQARAKVMQEQAAVNKAERDIERIKPLLAENAASQKEYDDAVSAEEQARAALEQAVAALEQADINLGYTRITAPISGITEKALQEEGSLVSAGTDSLLTRIHQIDPIYVNYSISDREYLKIRRQMDGKTILLPDQGNFDVQLTLSDGSIYPVMGKMNYMDTMIDSQTGTIQSRAEFANPGSMLVPNQFVRVTLKGAVRPNTFLVPQRAMLQDQEGHYLYIVNKQNKVERRPVEAGDWYGDDWIIERGLSDGDIVVVDGTINIQEGMQVKAVSLTGTPASSGSPAISGDPLAASGQ